MITSNAVGVYNEDGKHTAPPGHDNTNACRPVSRHNRLIASRAASVTTKRPPRVSTRSEKPRERCTVIPGQPPRSPHHTPARQPPPPEKQPPHFIARERHSPCSRGLNSSPRGRNARSAWVSDSWLQRQVHMDRGADQI